MSSQCNVALVFGASGITGWAIVRECLIYPSPNTFGRVIGLMHRELEKEDMILPNDGPGPRRWDIYSGMNLSKGSQYVQETLKEVEGIETVTHVYFAAYTGHGNDYQDLKRANVEILENALSAVEALCPKVKFWTLQTGGKAYGVEFLPHVPYNPPLSESSSRVQEPYASNIFYYAQHDLLARFSQDKSWTFAEIRPDAIIGFVPNNNAMNLAQGLALWLSIYRDLEGSGNEVLFPGDGKVWRAKHSDTSQDILARFHIFASFHPERTGGGKAFNVADGEVVSWEDIWAGICAWFGLVGVGPMEGHKRLTGAEWVLSKRGEWARWEEGNGVKRGRIEGTSWDFVKVLTESIDFDRQYELRACREAGFEEKVSTVMGYHLAFERMRQARIIP